MGLSPLLRMVAVIFSSADLTADAAGLASTASATPYGGFYPRNNDSTTAIASTGQASSSRPLPSMWSSATSRPFSIHRSFLSSNSVSSSVAPSSGIVPPYPSPTGTAANTASRGNFFSGGYGSLPTSTGSPSNGIPPYPYPSATESTAPHSGSLPVGTGGYYPAGNGTLGDTNSTTTIHSTRFITETLAPCTVNAIGANVYYWDKYPLDLYQCTGTAVSLSVGRQFCIRNQSTPDPYTLGAPATRTISTWTTPELVYVPTSTSFLIDRVSGYTDRTQTATNFEDNGSTYSKVTLVYETTVVGYTTTYSRTLYSTSTPPYPAPSDVLLPDMTQDGWTYAYTATSAQPNVLYSVFEIESQYVAPGPIPTIATSTVTFTAPVPFFGPYTGNFVGNYSVPNATGLVVPDAPGYLASAGAGDYVARCAAGTYRGTPTVQVVLVTIGEWGAVSPVEAHVSVLGGLTPTTTEPPSTVTFDPLAVVPLVGPIPAEPTSTVMADPLAVVPLVGPIPAGVTAGAIGSQQSVQPSLPKTHSGASSGQGGSGQEGSGQGSSGQGSSGQVGSQGISNNGGSDGGSGQGSSGQGSSGQGSSGQGSSGQGSSNQGSSNQGSSGQGSSNQGSSNQGSSNQGSSNQGSSNQGSSNQGSSNQGSSNQGSSNQGSSNQGSSNQGGSNQVGSQGTSNNGGPNGGSTQGSSGQGSSGQGGSNQGGSQGTSNNGGSNGGSTQGGSNGGSGPNSVNSGSSHQVAPGGHQGGSNQGGSNIDTGSSGAGPGNGQGGSNGQNGQGAQGGSGSGAGANGGQGGSGNSGNSGNAGGAPQSFETTVGNIPISVSGNTAIINGQTFVQTPGSPAITTTINNQPVVVSPSQVNIGGQIIPVPAAATAPSPAGPPSITFGASIITANPSSQFVIASQTLSPGSAIEVSGTKLSLGPSAALIVIGSSTVSLNHSPGITPAPSSQAFIFGGSTFTANPTAPIVIAGQTLSPGGPAITVSGTRLSLATSASQAVIGGVTIPLNTNTSPITAAPALTIGDQTITANPASQYAIAGQTLMPGGPAITVSGTRLSLAPSASQLVVGSSTIPLIAPGALPTLTIAGQTLTANPSNQYIIDGQTLAPGGPAITISGTRISLGPSASALVVGSKTLPLSAGAGQVTASPTLTIGSQTVTANAQGQYIIGGQTLTPGGVITVSGTPISLAPGVSDVVLGTSTEGLGGAIIGGFGPTAEATAKATGSIEGFKGEATTARRSHLCVILGVMVAVWLVS